MPELIFIHVPKAAGVSFLHTLRQVYGEDQVKQIWDFLPYGGDDSLHTLTSFLFRNHARFREVVWDTFSKPIDCKVLFGHMPAWVLDGLFPGVPRVVWLRNPVEQVLSRVFHFRQENLLGARHIEPKTLARRPIFRNPQFAYTGGFLSQFAFVGIVERYAQDLEGLGALLGWPKVDPVHIHKGEYESDLRQSLRDDAEFYDELRRINCWDVALYDYASSL